MEQADTSIKPRKTYKSGRWGGLMVFLRLPHYEIIKTWAKRSGMPRQAFFRAALLRGALEMAKGLGFDDKYPELED